MSKAVLISIRKEHGDKIFAGKKKWEGRKTCPNSVTVDSPYFKGNEPFHKSAYNVKFFVYEPKTGGGCGKVVGEFICDFALSFGFRGNARFDNISQALCVSEDFARSYFNKGKGYMIRVNEPKRYDQPKELSEFYRKCEVKECPKMCYDCFERPGKLKITRPPQSWCYVEEIK